MPCSSAEPAPAATPKLLALVLGLVTVSSSLAMNMFVPAFPEMAAALHTDSAGIQLSVTSYLLALAVGQNVFGPLSDRFGRKLPLYLGLSLFTAASVGVALADTLPSLIGWRFVQGIGACTAIVIPRAIVRDLHTGPAAARMLANIVLVVSVSPTLAPLAGSAVNAAFGWKAIFWLIGLGGFCILALTVFALPETLPRERRTQGRSAIGHYGVLLRSPVFVCIALMIAAGQSVYFAYLSGSAAVFMQHFGLDSWHYSIVFAAGAASWGLSAQFAPTLMRRFGPEPVAKACACAGLLITSTLFAAAILGIEGMWLLLISVLLLFPSIAILLPTGTVAALHPHGEAAGSASALIGTIGYAVGAGASGLVSLLADGTELPMLGVMAGCALAAALMAWLAFREAEGK